MSNDLTPFAFGDHLVRVSDQTGAPWFVLADVCRVLEIKNPSDASARLDDDEKMTLGNIEGHSGRRGGAQSYTIINESGLYSLVLTSRKPQARQFKKWVTAEVLPTLRKTGTYALADGGGAGDDIPTTDRRLWVDTISLALRVHGITAARALWAQSPLPSVTGGPEAGGPFAPEAAPLAADRSALDCLDHLLSWPMEAHCSFGATVGEALRYFCFTAPQMRREAWALSDMGIALAPPSWERYWAVAEKGPLLKQRFAKTPWHNAWADALRHVPGAWDDTERVSFPPEGVRASVLLPLDCL